MNAPKAVTDNGTVYSFFETLPAGTVISRRVDHVDEQHKPRYRVLRLERDTTVVVRISKELLRAKCRQAVANKTGTSKAGPLQCKLFEGGGGTWIVESVE